MTVYFWYDNLSRGILNSQKLRILIENGITGVTTNPNIFKNSLSNQEGYDLRNLKGPSTEDSCWKLMIEDVTMACETLEPVFNISGGLTGYVSIELNPFYANDINASYEQALMLAEKIKKDNLLVKVPATDAGLEVIEKLTASGINVNVTLIFSREQYLKVVDSYLRGLEKGLKEGRDISKIYSVASFFVSRVDAIISRLIADLLIPDTFSNLLGINNCYLVFHDFSTVFNSPRFKRLQEFGAHPQRLLWASTGVKDSKNPPDFYLKHLSIPNTILTLPDSVIDASINSGCFKEPVYSKVPELPEVLNVFQRFNHYGYPFEALMHQLLIEGVKIFQDAYTDLLEIVKQKLNIDAL